MLLSFSLSINVEKRISYYKTVEFEHHILCEKLLDENNNDRERYVSRFGW